jgi:hypothetical protein
MATDYASLKTEIADFLNRTDLTSVIDTFIDLCEAEMQRELKLLTFEVDSTLTVTAGVATLPTGFIGARSVTWLSSPPRPLIYVTPDAFERWEANTPSLVSYYTISGTTMRFSDGGTGTARVTGYARFIPLSGAATTNAIITNHPAAYLYGSLEHAAVYVKDFDGAVGYKAKFNDEMASVLRDNKDTKYAGATLAVRVA